MKLLKDEMIRAVKNEKSTDTKGSASESEFEEMPLTNVRKVIAKTMHGSLLDMAQLTHSFSFDATQLLNVRRWIKEKPGESGLGNITLNDMILYAVSRTLSTCPKLNARFEDNTVKMYKDVNLGVAVDTPRGLLVPTIFRADKLSLAELSAEAKRLAAGAQTGNIEMENLYGGTFTVTNLGMYGVEHFTPVINPPQTGILGVNNIQTRVKEADGCICAYPALGLSITYDHRVIDGAPVSRYMQTLLRFLERFADTFVDNVSREGE